MTDDVLGNVGGKFLFGWATSELWATDGSAAGTVKIAATAPSSNQGDTFTAVTPTLGWFSRVTYDNVAKKDAYKIWTTDGTEAGTKFVKQVRSRRSQAGPSSFSSALER